MPEMSVPRFSFTVSVAAATQPGSADGASNPMGAHQFSKTNLSKTVKHHWYGDTSPWTEQRLEDNYGFKGPQSRPAAKVVILDEENPPQPRSARTVGSEDRAAQGSGPALFHWAR